MIDKPDAKMWLLTLHNDDLVVAAAVLDNRWLKPSSPSWLASDGVQWNVLARMRGEKRAGIPLLAAIHITVKWASSG